MTRAKPKPEAQGDEHDQGDAGWFRWMDLAVIIACVVIVALAAEWLVGYLIRERLTAGARAARTRLARPRTVTSTDEPTTAE